MTDRTTVLNPNTGREVTTIATSIYQPVREAILAAVDEAGEDGLASGSFPPRSSAVRTRRWGRRRTSAGTRPPSSSIWRPGV